MLECSVEEYLRTETIRAGGRCEKIVDLTRIGHPDRECQWPVAVGGGGIDKVELKKPKDETRAGKIRPGQNRYAEFYASCGVPVYLIDTKEKVDHYIAARLSGRPARSLFLVPVSV